MADNARMATDSSKSSASKAKDADPADAPAAPAAPELTLQQWCAVTGQVPHRIRAFAAQAANAKAVHTADAWAAQFDDFNKQPVS